MIETKQLPSIPALIGSPKTIRITMYAGFTPPVEIFFEIFKSNVKQYAVTATYTAETRTIECTFTADQISRMPVIADLRIRFDEAYAFQADIKPSTEANTGTVSGFNVTVSGDTYIVVEVIALDVVAAQVAIATEKAEQTAEDRVATGEDRDAVANDKDTVAADKAIVAADKATTVAAKTAAEEARDVANDAKTGAELARDVAIENQVIRIYVASYAEAQPYFSGPTARNVFVANDELYGYGEKTWYQYDPVMGEALNGIDYDYKTL